VFCQPSPSPSSARFACSLTSAREEAIRIGHFVANLELGRGLESHRGDTGDQREHDRRVLAPVTRTTVPATGRGPDVLWVAVVCLVNVFSFEQKGGGGIDRLDGGVGNGGVGSKAEEG
jgi:hypothetical protein